MKTFLFALGFGVLLASTSAAAFELRRDPKPKDYPICPIVCEKNMKIDDPCTKSCVPPESAAPQPPRCPSTNPDQRGCRFPLEEY